MSIVYMCSNSPSGPRLPHGEINFLFFFLPVRWALFATGVPGVLATGCAFHSNIAVPAWRGLFSDACGKDDGVCAGGLEWGVMSGA